MGEEHPLKNDGLGQLIDMMEHNIDLDRLLDLTSVALPNAAELRAPAETKLPVRIGVARDAAFCFYYQDNLDMLSDEGAELVYFSPMTDTKLPPDLQGLYLGGGYPELHAAQLCANQSMLADIAKFSASGKPVYAECGGFMYLTRSITDQNQHTYPMAGVFPFDSTMQPRLRSLGYRQAHLIRPTLLAPEGAVLHGHEFHYSTVDGTDDTPCAYVLDDNRNEGYSINNTLAGYLHLHWGKTPEVATHFIQACRQHKGKPDGTDPSD